MILRGTVFSTVLEMETGLTILFPGEGGTPSPLSVAYVFHGLSAGSGSWLESSLMAYHARRLNTLFVFPEVGRSYFFDMCRGQDFFTYVVDELPDIVSRNFAISTRRVDTAVIGVSMGGYGALKCALSRPERFGTCCAFSSGSLYLREFVDSLREKGDWKRVARLVGKQRVRDLHNILGDDLAVQPADELTALAATAAERCKNTRFYAACGTGDGFYHANVRFRDEMLRLGYRYTFEEWPGEHEAAFFNEAMRRALLFCYPQPSEE